MGKQRLRGSDIAVSSKPCQESLTVRICHPVAITISGYNSPATSAPVQHPAFPHQSNAPQPGTSVHHHHQNHK